MNLRSLGSDRSHSVLTGVGRRPQVEARRGGKGSVSHGKLGTEPGPGRYIDLNPDQRIAVRRGIPCMLQLVNATNCQEISGSTEVVEAPYIAEIV